MVADKISNHYYFSVPTSFGAYIPSACIDCGIVLSMCDAIIDDGKVAFVCDECYKWNSIEDYLSNISFATNYPCVVCTAIIDFNANQCPYCSIEISKTDWNNYVAYILDLPPYDKMSHSEGWDHMADLIAGSGTSYRKKYEKEINTLQDICFLCFVNKADCICSLPLTMNKINTLPIPSLRSIYYSVDFSDPDELAKEDLTCTKCKWQYTSNCKPLALELLNVDIARYEQDRHVMIENELVTCEYFAVDDTNYDEYNYMF